jgi:hypothetical protein
VWCSEGEGKGDAATARDQPHESAPRRHQDTKKTKRIFFVLRVLVVACDRGRLQYRQRTYNVDVTSPRTNALGQPIGPPVGAWTPPPRPPRDAMTGRYCRVERLDAARHARDLHEANTRDAGGGNWTYLPYGPFDSLDAYAQWAAGAAAGSDPLFHAIVDLASSRAVGVASANSILLVTFVSVLVNLVADLLYGYADPRIKY